MMNYIIIAVVCCLQSAIFTLNSRSRASGNIGRQFMTSMASNGTWFLVTFLLIFPEIFKSVAEGDMKERIILMIVYSASSAVGAALMMMINLGIINIPYLTETGKSKVGSR